MMASAADLGKKLLAEVQVVGLDEVCCFRTRNISELTSFNDDSTGPAYITGWGRRARSAILQLQAAG